MNIKDVKNIGFLRMRSFLLTDCWFFLHERVVTVTATVPDCLKMTDIHVDSTSMCPSEGNITSKLANWLEKLASCISTIRATLARGSDRRRKF